MSNILSVGSLCKDLCSCTPGPNHDETRQNSTVRLSRCKELHSSHSEIPIVPCARAGIASHCGQCKVSVMWKSSYHVWLVSQCMTTRRGTALDSSSVTFPLDKNFSHDNQVVFIYNALGLFVQPRHLDLTVCFNWMQTLWLGRWIGNYGRWSLQRAKHRCSV